jgi:hypothetical protein
VGFLKVWLAFVCVDISPWLFPKSDLQIVITHKVISFLAKISYHYLKSMSIKWSFSLSVTLQITAEWIFIKFGG